MPEAAAHYDVLVVGGGMVGGSLACALGGSGLRVGLVEAVPFAAAQHPGYDDRTLALALGSQRIFRGLGLWASIAPGATPIHRIHISDRGRPGAARLDRGEEGVEALGYVAEARLIGAALGERLESLDGVDLLIPASLEALSVHRDRAVVRLRRGEERLDLAASVVVAADGARSRVREGLGIAVHQRDYGQWAVIANVTPGSPHRNTAFERFTDAGPLALLPLSEGRCALVLTVPAADAPRILALSDEAFLAHLQSRFGDRLGTFRRVGCRQGYPLTLIRSRESVRPRVALIGNAAHTLHPVAGQGFNLGLRDAATLAEVLLEARRVGKDPGGIDVLGQYARWRRGDQDRTVAFTDALARLFTSPLAPLRLGRSLGLIAFDLTPMAKRHLARQSMGLAGRLPRLARGL